jgi:hypothetical protein
MIFNINIIKEGRTMKLNIRYMIPVALCGLLIGCMGNITVKMDQYGVENVGETLLAQVKVNDLRATRIASSTREALGTPMGNIYFNPSEGKLVKNALELELSRLMKEKGIQTKMDFSCDIIEFGIYTPSTALYWDVTGRIRLALKQNGKEYDLFGTYTERTYIWPSETLITKVANESFNQIITSIKDDVSF